LNATISFPSPSKCTKIVGVWGFAPDPTVGAYSAPQTGLRKATSKGKGKRRKGKEGE